MASSASLLQTVLALGFVLLLILATAWAFRRLQRPLGGAAALLQIRSQVMVGTRERVVLIEVGDQWIVAGVAAGSVQALAVLPRQEVAGPAPAGTAGAPNFAALLERFKKPQ